MPDDRRIRRRLRLRDLDTLMAVAQTGSMAKAAVQLSVSQPAVSKAIAEMERTLGYQLLDRTAQGVEPNLYGRALLKCGTALFDDLRQGLSELEFIADPTVGELRIGAAEPIVAGLLPVIMARLTRRHPRLTFHVIQLHSIPLFDELIERRADLIVARLFPSRLRDEFDAETLFDEPQFVAAGLKNRWTRRRRIELAELIDEPWTLPDPTTFAGMLVGETFKACGLNYPHTRVVCNSIQMHSALLATGDYLAMYPRSMIRFAGSRLATRILPVVLPRRPAPVAIIRLKDRTVSPVAQLFIECAREVSKPLANER
jgi:DNA-binding transcriptional LysR family regulator